MDIALLRDLERIVRMPYVRDRQAALRALAHPDIVLACLEEQQTEAVAARVDLSGVTMASVSAALRELGPGLHRVWHIQEKLGLPVGKGHGSNAWSSKNAVIRTLLRLRKLGLVKRDPEGGGWSVV